MRTTANSSQQHERKPGPQSAAADQHGGHLHGTWASVAGAWGEHAEYVDLRSAQITHRMLELAQLSPGQRVLELACGAGGAGLEAARLVGPTGEVVLSDVVPEMTAIARSRAEALGLENVRTKELDLEQIAQPDESYDAVLCRDGLMLVPDPGLAAREICRVLRPGGRVALAVWGPRARNPLIGILFDSLGAQLGVPMPPPGVPGPFSLEDPDKLASLLAQAGLTDVAIREESTPALITSFEDWWTKTCALAGPLQRALSGLPRDAAKELRARAREAVRPYETSSGLDFPGVSLVASGERP